MMGTGKEIINICELVMFIICCANYDLLKFHIGFDRNKNIMYFYLSLCFYCCQFSTNNNNNNNNNNNFNNKTSFHTNTTITEEDIIFVHELFNWTNFFISLAVVVEIDGKAIETDLMPIFEWNFSFLWFYLWEQMKWLIIISILARRLDVISLPKTEKCAEKSSWIL